MTKVGERSKIARSKGGGGVPILSQKIAGGGRCLGNFITQLMYKSAAVLGWLFLTFFTLKGEVGGVVNFLTFLRGGCKFSCISHTGGGVDNFIAYPNYPNSTRVYYFTPAIFTA